MKVRTALRRLALAALVAAMVLPAMPGHASGTSPIVGDTANDVVDYLKHTQNSWRPDPTLSPWKTYQYACKSDSLAVVDDCRPFDVKDVQVSSDSIAGTMSFRLHLNGNAPVSGDPATALPAPFSSVTYAVYFATSTQETAQQVGSNCVTNVDDLTIVENVGATITYAPHGSCKVALDESKGTQDGTKTQAVSSINPIMAPPHPTRDGWLAVAEIETTVVSNGAPKGTGSGTVSCKGGAQVCLDYDMQVGDYEGYSGFSETNDMRDFDPASQAKMGFSITGNQIDIRLPWNPTTITTDGDGLVDDAVSFPWKLGASGAKITAMIGETSGVVQAGANSATQLNAVCPDDGDNIIPESAEPLRTVGAAVGTAQRAVGDATGFYLFGDGHDQGDCIRGIYGLVTLLDWAPNDGFELRQFPRMPAYLPSAQSVGCRYPIGHFPAPPAPVTVEQAGIGPTSSPGISANTSPFDEPYTVKVYAGSSTPAASQAGQVLPNPNVTVDPLAGQVGVDKACNYTYGAYGLHYFDKLSPDVPM